MCPAPLRNEDFTRQLGQALGRPVFLPAPTLLLSTVLGELSHLMLDSLRVLPEARAKAGLPFQFPDMPAHPGGHDGSLTPTLPMTPLHPMSAPQNRIALIFDYDQTLTPNYMQDEALFPAFGIEPGRFWQRCAELVKNECYDSELAYMKVLLDTLGLDRPTNQQLRDLGANLTFYPGLPEMFEQFAKGCWVPRRRRSASRWSITSSPAG